VKKKIENKWYEKKRRRRGKLLGGNYANVHCEATERSTEVREQ